MKEALQIIEEQATLRIQVRSKQTFDLSVLSQNPQPDLYLECSAQNSEKGLIEYSTDSLISLDAFVRQIELDKADSCSFLFSLFTPLAAALKNQPVILDIRTIFLSPKGDQILLVRAPLILECWMRRQEEIEDFLLKLMEILPSDSLEVFGLLWKGIRRHLRFEDLLEDLEDLYQSCLHRRLFGRRQSIPPYRSRKAVFVNSAFENGSGKDPAGSKEVRRRDQQVSASSLQPDNEKSVCFEPALNRQSRTERRADYFEPWQSDLLDRKDSSLFSAEPTDEDQLPPALFHESEQVFSMPKRFELPAAGSCLLNPSGSSQTALPNSRQRKTELPAAEPAENPTGEERNPDPNCTLLLESLIRSSWLETDGQQFTLEGEDLLVGRGNQCAIQLLDPSVSSKHARLFCQQERWYIQDLKSTNGTWLNEKRVIRRMRLREGMVIRFGNRTALFHEQSLHDY